jgi:leader peptidase (prepilin peptidase)/N-methyltransferase
LVELLSAAFAAMTCAKFGIEWQALIVYALIASLLVITFIDIDHRIIPDLITLPGIHRLGCQLRPRACFTAGGADRGLAGGGSLFLVAWGYQLIAKREGMGAATSSCWA